MKYSGRETLVYFSVTHLGDFYKIYESILNKEIPSDEQIEEALKKVKSKYVTILDDDYPNILRQSQQPPFVLYYYGNIKYISEYEKCLAVIGSRDYSEYGSKVTKSFVSCLAKYLIIISGMARGIDTIAQQTAHNVGGKTVAVLGSGIDYCYPKSNLDFYNLLKEKHLVISEYPGDMEPKPENFPIRNRLVAGLSKCILIPEAKKRSGTSTTAMSAIMSNRDVYCVPTNIYEDSLCNELIADGAILVENPKDILKDMKVEVSKSVF